jgi:pyridoxine 5-phosphate synthase
MEPDPVVAAGICEIAGAEGIVCHLREDRRHAQDRDIRMLKEMVQTKFDLEMAASDEIIKIALDIVPDLVTIVPEKRAELTTEGGLNVALDIMRYTKLSDDFHNKGIEVSYFVEPTREQIDAVKKAHGDMVELHTGTYANLRGDHRIPELQRIIDAAEYANSAGLKVAAGHGLNYVNTRPIAKIPYINELSIGHAVMARAIFTGLKTAVQDMMELIRGA